MKTFKSKSDALRSARLPLFLIGLLFASSIVLTTFEWKLNYQIPIGLDAIGTFHELPPEEVLIIANFKKPPPPPPAPRKDQFEIIDNSMDITATIDLGDLDFAEEPIIEEIPLIDEGDDLDGVIELYRADVPPSFPGGEAALMKYLVNTIKYAPEAKRSKIEGTVWVEFIIGKDGSVYDVKIVRGIGGGCDEETLRAVLQMPQWLPGKQKGIPVNVRFTLPVTFKLQ